MNREDRDFLKQAVILLAVYLSMILVFVVVITFFALAMVAIFE